MNKIIAKTIKKAYKHWKPNPLVRCYHYAAAFDGNKMIEFAQNDPVNTNAKAYKLGLKFNVRTFYDYPYLHSESYLVSKLLHRYNTILPSWSMVVLRINREGRILLSKPCKKCQKILNAVDFKRVYFSLDGGKFVE
jgi:hypothetical protein